MRAGGGKNKGSAFERHLCQELSMWLTDGTRRDVFSRNVLSGGRFTNALRTGQEVSMPGDIAAAHPLAFDFLTLFSVEAKFHRDIGLDTYLFSPNKSFLGRVYKHTTEQAREVKLRPMVIAKQNFRDTIVLVEREVGECVLSTTNWKLMYHSLQRDTVMLLPFQDVINLVDALPFLAAVRKLNTPPPSNVLPLRKRNRIIATL